MHGVVKREPNKVQAFPDDLPNTKIRSVFDEQSCMALQDIQRRATPSDVPALSKNKKYSKKQATNCPTKYRRVVAVRMRPASII
jgi:hypothetical protein